MAATKKHHAWSQAEELWLIRNYASTPWPEIMARLPFAKSRDQVQQKAKTMGLVRDLTRFPNGRPCTFTQEEIQLAKEFGPIHREYMAKRDLLRHKLRHMEKTRIRQLLSRYAKAPVEGEGW